MQLRSYKSKWEDMKITRNISVINKGYSSNQQICEDSHGL